jgi:hypothetical protein
VFLMYSSSWKHGHRHDETLHRHRQCKEAQFSAALEIEVSCGVFVSNIEKQTQLLFEVSNFSWFTVLLLAFSIN